MVSGVSFPLLVVACWFLLARTAVASEVQGSRRHGNIKTECLAADDSSTSFHCLPVEPLRIPCKDVEVDECPKWAAAGECQKNPQYMLVQCRNSCQSCIDLHFGGVSQIAPEEYNRHDILSHLVETQEYQHLQAVESVDRLKKCVDNHQLCAHWSIQGECESNADVKSQCPAACRTCHQL